MFAKKMEKVNGFEWVTQRVGMESSWSWSGMLNVGSEQLASVLMLIYLTFTVRTLPLDSIHFHFDNWTRVRC
jgi:hypothetical protein